MATKVVRDSDLANKLRSATASGEALVEADGHRFLVIRVPRVMELDDPDEMAMALEAAQEYFGRSYEASEVIKIFRHELAKGE